jgi:hypothetical protein
MDAIVGCLRLEKYQYCLEPSILRVMSTQDFVVSIV